MAEFFALDDLAPSSLTPKFTTLSFVARAALCLQVGWMAWMAQVAVVPCPMDGMAMVVSFLAASVVTGHLASASEVGLEPGAKLANPKANNKKVLDDRILE